MLGILNIDKFFFIRLDMNQFYCPFCSSRYQIHKNLGDGVLICGHCGDKLIKKPLISSRRIIGIVAASAFLAPLLIMVSFVIKNFTKDKFPNKSESLILLAITK
tara:strand:+ start:189 stop:500 length:312 start_codon:yes stop_codon:yes gene_type:complete